jgi:hypothetical protein
VKVLFQRPYFARGLGWDRLAPLLPGWQIDWCEPDQTAEPPLSLRGPGSGILKAWPTIFA